MAEQSSDTVRLQKATRTWPTRISRWLAVISVALMGFALVIIPILWVKAWTMGMLPYRWGASGIEYQYLTWWLVPELYGPLCVGLSASATSCISAFVALAVQVFDFMVNDNESVAVGYSRIKWRALLFGILLAIAILFDWTNSRLLSGVLE